MEDGPEDELNKAKGGEDTEEDVTPEDKEEDVIEDSDVSSSEDEKPAKKKRRINTKPKGNASTTP